MEGTRSGWCDVRDDACCIDFDPRMSGDFVQCMSDVWMFSECIEESVCDCAAEASRSRERYPASYRPIGLLSVLGKTLERMMVAHLDSRLSNRMNEAQHGFRGGRSTESAWR